MNFAPTTFRPPAILAALSAAILALSGVVYQAHNLRIGLDADDTENLESTLVLVAADQYREGAGRLYGPYSGENPRVLIQAPLYYRITALAAWPVVRLGVRADTACLYLGRLISGLAFLSVLVVAQRIAAMDGGTKTAGWWAVGLIAASPVFGGFPVTMRPDMMGLALQTFGAWLVLRSARDRGAWLPLAYLAFALAACTKQHFVGVAVVSSILLGWGVWRKEIGWRRVVLAHAIYLVVVLGYYAAEYRLTGGMLWRSAFLTPGAMGKVTAGSWGYVGLVFVEAAKRSAALLALGLAAALVLGRRTLASRLDGCLMAYIAVDLALMMKLCLNSSGGWYNYAMQAAIFGAVLLGRSLDRALREPAKGVRKLAIGMAATVALVGVARNVASSTSARREHVEALGALLGDPRTGAVDPSGRYFAGSLQHCNRRFGSVRLAHDEWLYKAFESVASAEPRERWLKRALIEGPVKQVVLPGESPTVPGVAEPLPYLGYRPVDRFGRYRVWERR